MGTKNNITKLILLVLEKSVDGYVRFENFTYHSYRYLDGYPEIKKASLAQALKRLRKRGLIDFVDDQKLAYRLTDKGKQKAVWESIRIDNKKWDDKWRVVIFDVPEKRRQARDLLRESLKNWGFIPWQQSVWATKKDCLKPLRDYIRNIGIGDWVIVLETGNVSR